MTSVTPSRIPKWGLIASLFAAALMVMSASLSSAHAVSLYTIKQSQSGLVAQDSLTTGNTASWVFGGSAVGQPGATYQYYEDSQGLHIGVQSGPNLWAGYYAVAQPTAQVFHAVLTLPSSTIPSQFFNTGLYVQTGAPLINYVTCAGQVSSAGVYWAVGMATGDANQAATFTTLWQSAFGTNQPLTRDCTIVTNGNNLLTVYLDGTQVYTSNSLSLGYQSPFMVFLEVQSSYSGGMLFSTYRDYYAAKSDSITITGVPTSSVGEIVDPSGAVLAQAPVDSSGTVTLNIGRYHMPLVANIEVFTLGVQTATTASPVPIWGGDSYSLSLLGLVGP
jgi:hypothetical protein